MFYEPRVSFCHGGDAFGDEVFEGFHLLARDQAYPPLGDERFRDGRGPIARPHDAYVDGHLVRHPVVERVTEDGVSLLLQLTQVREDGDELLERRDALVPDGGMGRAAWDLQPEHERTALGRHEGETGRLGYEGGVCPVTAQNGR